MRRFLAVFVASSLVLLGAEAALASMPHSHGADFNHSAHGSCPVHQIGLHGIDLVDASAALPDVKLAVSQVAALPLPWKYFSLTSSAHSRGPPASV